MKEEKVMQKVTAEISVTRTLKRDGNLYNATYNIGESGRETLTRLVKTVGGIVIPSSTQTFRRLADGNRGQRFKSVN